MSDNTEKNAIKGGTLYLVATPIGNLSDLSPRASKVLSEVDFIAAEDTRVTAKITTTLGVKKPMVIYHEHNKAESGKKIVSRLLEGESCALVTDAGTPGISDPGADIVSLCVENDVNVTSVPGPCAAINALILSGFDTHHFVFEGFVEGSDNRKREVFEKYINEERTSIFYESPHGLTDTLEMMADVLGGERKVAICREMTKLNEEVLRMTLDEAVDYYTEKSPKGEYVLILEGGAKKENALNSLSIEKHIDYYVDMGLKKMDAIKQVAKDRGVSKNEIYKETLK